MKNILSVIIFSVFFCCIKAQQPELGEKKALGKPLPAPTFVAKNNQPVSSYKKNVVEDFKVRQAPKTKNDTVGLFSTNKF